MFGSDVDITFVYVFVAGCLQVFHKNHLPVSVPESAV